MKWIAVSLVLINVGAYFWIERQGSIEIEPDPNQFEGINLDQMSLKSNDADQIDAQAARDDSVTRIDLTKEDPKELTFVVDTSKKVEGPVLEPKREPLPKAEINTELQESFIADTINMGNSDANKNIDQMQFDVDQALQQNETDDEKDDSVLEARLCYRVGPYKASGALKNAISVLDANEVAHTDPKIKREKKIKATRVYLGPYKDQKTLDIVRAKLKKQKVDHYVLNKGGEAILQLGYFSNVKRGENYRSRLLKIDFDVKLEKVYQDKVVDAWIYFEIRSEAKLKELDELKLYRTASIEKQSCN